MSNIELSTAPSQNKESTEVVSRYPNIQRLLVVISSAVAAICIMGCKKKPENELNTRRSKMVTRSLNSDPKQIRYTYDQRTNKCFAIISTRNGNAEGIGFANVPCDKKVKAQIGKNSK